MEFSVHLLNRYNMNLFLFYNKQHQNHIQTVTVKENNSFSRNKLDAERGIMDLVISFGRPDVYTYVVCTCMYIYVSCLNDFSNFHKNFLLSTFRSFMRYPVRPVHFYGTVITILSIKYTEPSHLSIYFSY